jgi:hypothetical protein
MAEIKKLVPVVVGEPMEGAQNVANAGDFDEAPTDSTLVQGRLIMDYGDSGDGKSTRAHSFARYYFIKTGLPVVLIGAEDSSKAVFQDLIDAGIVVPVWITGSTTPISMYERLTEGDLPVGGAFEEISKTIKKDGKDVTTVSLKQKWTKREENIGNYSAYIFEGLSTIAENILDHLRETGRFPREQSDGFVEGGRTFMAASQTAYGFAQSEGIKLVRTSGMLPVERVLWTSHESKGKDEFDGSLVRGPKLVGSAATNVMRKHVGVLLHTERVNGEIRTYFDNHPDQQSPKVEWKSKITVSPFFAREMKKRHPGSYFVPQLPKEGQDLLTAEDGLIPFLRLEEEIRAKAGAGAKGLADAVRQVLSSKARSLQTEESGDK